MAGFPDPLIGGLAAATIRASCRLAVRRIDLHVEGERNIPATGPAVIAPVISTTSSMAARC